MILFGSRFDAAEVQALCNQITVRMKSSEEVRWLTEELLHQLQALQLAIEMEQLDVTVRRFR